MIDDRRQGERREEKERVRRRMHARVDPDKYDYYPEKEQIPIGGLWAASSREQKVSSNGWRDTLEPDEL